MLILPPPRIHGRAVVLVSLAMLVATSSGCRSRFFAIGSDAGAGPSTTGQTPPAMVPTPISPAPVDTQLPEPDPVPSDSAGVARLRVLMEVWHLVSLYHAAVVERGAPWDSAFIRAATVVRSASDARQLSAAYRRLFSVLQDPLTRVEPANSSGATTQEPGNFRISSERTRDSILIVRVPLGAAHRRLLTDSAAVQLQQQLSTASGRVILDVRGAAEPSTAGDEPIDVVVERFASAAGMAARFNTTLTTASAERTRRIGGARFVDGTWQPDDAWILRSGRPVLAGASQPGRVVVLANGASVLPRALIALVAAGRATLLAEEGVDDAPLVSSVVLPIADGVSVRLRVGDLIHADGGTGLVADTVLPRAVSASDSAPVLRAALTLLRTNRVVTGTQRASRTLARRLPAVLPSYYGRDPYPFMGARLLAAAQLWSAIRVRHVHRDLYDDDMDAVLEQTIPRLEAARSASEYAAALLPMVSALNDTPTNLQGASADSVRGLASAPFRVRWIEDRAIITDVVRDSVTRALGIDVGMEVTAADGFPMSAWVLDHRTAVSAPNTWSRLGALVPAVARGVSGGALFRLRDFTNRERQVNVPRRASYMAPLALSERPNTGAVRSLPGEIAYLDVERLSADSVGPALARSRGARAWILDLRGTLHSGTAEAIIAAVRREPVTVVAREVRRYDNEPCVAPTLREARQRCAQTRDVRARVSRGDTAGHYVGRVVALIDERTDGSMERLAIALDAVAAVTFIGSSSAGSPGEVMDVTLPGQLHVALPIVEIRRSDDAQLQRIGLTPSIEARRTVRGVRSGVDDVIERAQQWLVQQLDAPVRRRR